MRIDQIPQMLSVLPESMTWPRPQQNMFACILFYLSIWHDQDHAYTCLHVFLCLRNQHPLRMKILRGLIKYARNMYDGRTQKIPSEDTIVLLPEEKSNSCRSDIECWRVPGACISILIDDGVTSMMNASDCDNAMLGKITFFENLPFLTIDNWPTR